MRNERLDYYVFEEKQGVIHSYTRSNKSASNFNQQNVPLFFDELTVVCDKYGFAAFDIWIVDETGVTTVQQISKFVDQKETEQVGGITPSEEKVCDKYGFAALDIWILEETGVTTVQKISKFVDQKETKQFGVLLPAKRRDDGSIAEAKADLFAKMFSQNSVQDTSNALPPSISHV
ncbi:hypothetical protein HHI36_010966 [Cryptolaemus montrouzieri]|uniref:Uncharacterized protein n=1 Tax=Cryptolaemus montrouzieri TaxID=559131 RepID=A0ABD2MKC0_9CUCU